MSTSTVSIFLRIDAPEPIRGSVVMLEGPAGTAYQRLNSTGLWHSTTKSATGLSWAQLVEKASRRGAFPLLLLHDAETGNLTLPAEPSELPLEGGDDVAQAG